jgi:nucleoid DNA-binding protein
MLLLQTQELQAAAKLALESFLGNVSGTLKTGGRVSLVGFGSWSVSAEQRETVEILKQEKRFKAAKNVVNSGCRIRRCSKLIVSFKPIIIKPSLWKVFYVFKRFYLVFSIIYS